jgi:peptidoglycan hydrolase CwlO-like protein
MSNNIEDLIRDLINDALNEFKDYELEEVKQDAYDNTREVDYRVDNADADIDDLKNQISDLENRLDSLEQMSND